MEEYKAEAQFVVKRARGRDARARIHEPAYERNDSIAHAESGGRLVKRTPTVLSSRVIVMPDAVRTSVRSGNWNWSPMYWGAVLPSGSSIGASRIPVRLMSTIRHMYGC